MLNSEQYIPAGLLRMYTDFGTLGNSQDHWLWSCQILFSGAGDNMQKRTFFSSLLLLCCHLQSLLPKLCFAKCPNPPKRSPSHERGCFLHNRRMPLPSPLGVPIRTQNQRPVLPLLFNWGCPSPLLRSSETVFVKWLKRPWSDQAARIMGKEC